MSEDSKDEQHEFPRWEELFQQQEVESEVVKGSNRNQGDAVLPADTAAP